MIERKDKIVAQLSAMNRIQIAFLTWKRYHQKHLLPYGITLKQAFLLEQLVERDFMYPAEIASKLFCDRPTVTVIVRNMEKRDWVKRQKDTQNRKRTRVSITAAGRQKIAEVQQSPWGSTDPSHNPLSCFDEAELAELERLLGKLNKRIKEISQGTL